MIEYFTKIVSVGNETVFPDIQFFREWLAEQGGIVTGKQIGRAHV